jgi:predicted nucleic acid-binding protein
MSSPSQRVGLDTSIVLRLLTGEPAAQATKAVAMLDELRASGKRGAVNDLVVSEAYFALQYHYEVPKQLALDKLREFLESPEVEPTGQALFILEQPNLGKAKPGFVDRVIHAQYLQTASGMMTFEKAAAKLPQVAVPN